MSMKKGAFFSVLAALLAGMANPAVAAGPEPWQLYFQPAVTPVMHQLTAFQNMLMWIITGITIFVFGLLGYVMVRFRASRNPVPSKTSHHTVLEIVWTTVPVMILLIIAVPSFRLLYFADKIKTPEMTLKVVGHQWYWSYEYPDFGNFTFDANLIPDEDIKGDQKRLLETDNKVVLPVDTDIRVLIAGPDVIHSWAVPAFGVKTDVMPGRLNETWVRIDKEGTYYGQCSQLCGVNHAYMPIQVQAVSKDAFKAWVVEAKKKFAAADAPVRLAQTSAQ